jgi:hypothetical protein
MLSSFARLLPARQQSTSSGQFGWLVFSRLSQLLDQSYCTKPKAQFSSHGSDTIAKTEAQVELSMVTKERKMQIEGLVQEAES